jgi:hypothetical protein
MYVLSKEAMQITAELNNSYHSPEEIRILISKLIGNPVDETFGMFPPFYTDCGKNIAFGKMCLLIHAAVFKIKEVLLSEIML